MAAFYLKHNRSIIIVIIERKDLHRKEDVLVRLPEYVQPGGEEPLKCKWF